MEGETRGGPSPGQIEAVGVPAVILVGVLTHFAYAASGGSDVVAALMPANESVWEHLKMVLVPVLALGVVEMRWLPDWRRLWWAKLVEVVTAAGFVVGFFYTYTGAFGIHSILPVDIASYVVAIVGGQWLSHRIITSTRSRSVPLAVSVPALLVLVVGFGVLTFAPPQLPLFRDSSIGGGGPG